MSMTGSMCVSMTGRPTPAQIANNERRAAYSYYQIATAYKKPAGAQIVTGTNSRNK